MSKNKRSVQELQITTLKNASVLKTDEDGNIQEGTVDGVTRISDSDIDKMFV